MTTAHCIDIKDFRKESRQQKSPMIFDVEAIEVALAVVGVEITPNLQIKVRIKDGDGNAQGLCQQLGKESFRVTVRVAKKAAYADRHHYVVNNSLLHELRHVAQMQADPQQGQKYALANKVMGYGENPYEVEARFFGRVADHTGTKATGPAGPAMGKSVWAIHFGCVSMEEAA